MNEIEVANIDIAKLSAEELDCGVRQLGQIMGFCAFQQGAWLKELRDGKKYRDLDYDSFKSYVSTLDMSRATAYKRIDNYEYWILGLGLSLESVQDIALNRLQIIKPIVETDPSRWLGEARVLSTSDLINSVREEKGREPMTREEPDHITSFSKKQRLGSSYPEIALSLPCPICGGVPVEKAHYPTTVKAGAKEDEFIPLCHECHMGQHQVGFTSWFDMYGNLLFKNFIYPMFRKIQVRGGGCNSLEDLEPNGEMRLVTTPLGGVTLQRQARDDNPTSPATEPGNVE